MSLISRVIKVQFNLANGEFEGGGNTAVVNNLRVIAHIDGSAGPSQSTADVSIYGMSLSLMNQLATVGNQYAQRSQNGIIIEAGDDENTSVVFQGTIFNAYLDASDMENACFRVVASPGGYWNVVPATPLTIQGTADVAGMFQTIASAMGLQFENNGVNLKMSNPYYAGSPWQQAMNLAKHANVNIVIEQGVLAITPLGTPRSGDAVEINPATGMIGYPAFVQNNIILQTLFVPGLKMNATINVTSDLKPACGQWIVRSLAYDLESQNPHGRWYTTIEANPAGTQ